MSGRTVEPEKILKELSDLWVSSAKEGQSHGATGVLRACSMTLLVVSEQSEDTQDIGETIAALMPEHPARTILIRLSGEGERALSERVYSQCWMPFGQRRQICCEQVELTVSDAALADLRSVVLPLAVPDLPVILWCRSPRLCEMREFWQIAVMAQKVILDSGVAHDQVGSLLRVASMSAGGLMLGDLAWSRLTRWREMLSQVFENRSSREELQKVTSARVSYPAEFESSARYMGAWLTGALHDAGVEVAATLEPVEAEFRVQLEGSGIRLELGREDERMVVTLNGQAQCTSLPRTSDYPLLREELSILRHDLVFERTLASAAELAYPVES